MQAQLKLRLGQLNCGKILRLTNGLFGQYNWGDLWQFGVLIMDVFAGLLTQAQLEKMQAVREFLQTQQADTNCVGGDDRQPAPVFCAVDKVVAL